MRVARPSLRAHTVPYRGGGSFLASPGDGGAARETPLASGWRNTRELASLGVHVACGRQSPLTTELTAALTHGISRSPSSTEHRSVSIQSPCPCLPVPADG